MSNTATSGERLLEIDALRGLAAIAVVLYHYTFRYHQIFDGTPATFLFEYGYLGVEIFFGISGFVILMTLEKSKTVTDFIISRLSRLYPAYWTALILTFGASVIWPLSGRTVSLPEALVNLTMWQEVVGFRHVDGVYWSLQVELIFYTLMIFLFVVGWLPRAIFAMIIWMVISMASKLLSVILGYSVPYRMEQLLLLPYCGFFSIGAVSYVAFRARKLSWEALFSFALAVVVSGLWRGIEGAVVATFASFLFSLIVLRKSSILRAKILVGLGAISYPLYLVHQNIGYTIISQLKAVGFPGLAPILSALLC